MNYVQATVADGSVNQGGKGRLTLNLDKELPVIYGRILLLDPSQRMPRILGYGVL